MKASDYVLTKPYDEPRTVYMMTKSAWKKGESYTVIINDVSSPMYKAVIPNCRVVYYSKSMLKVELCFYCKASMQEFNMTLYISTDELIRNLYVFKDAFDHRIKNEDIMCSCEKQEFKMFNNLKEGLYVYNDKPYHLVYTKLGKPSISELNQDYNFAIHSENAKSYDPESFVKSFPKYDFNFICEIPFK